MPSPDCSCITAGFGVHPSGGDVSVPHGLLSAGHPGYKNDKEARVSPKTGGRSIHSEGPTAIRPGQYRITPHRHFLCRTKNRGDCRFSPPPARQRPVQAERQAAYPARRAHAQVQRAPLPGSHIGPSPRRRDSTHCTLRACARPKTQRDSPGDMPSRPLRQERKR